MKTARLIQCRLLIWIALIARVAHLHAGSVDLAVTLSDVPDPVRAGNYLTNFVTVTNVSSQVAANVTVSECLDLSVDFVSVSPPSSSYTISNGILQCYVGTLNPGSGARLTVVLLPKFSGTITNVVSATTSDTDTNSINNNAATVTAVDDYPSISIDDFAVVEGSSSTNVNFMVQLSAKSDSALSARFRTVTVNAQSPPPAGADIDYRATNGVVLFAPGTTNAAVSVQIYGDRLYEYNEKFLVYLERNSGAPIADDTGWCTIVDDDMPQVLVTNPTVVEGNGNSSLGVLQVTLSNPADRPLQGEFSTASGTATPGADYQSTGNFLFFDPGVTNQTLPFTIFGDTHYESNETFFVNVSLWSVGGAQATCTILDDDFYLPAWIPTNGGFQVQLIGAPGSNYVIQGTTNFASWVPLATNSAPAGGSVIFFDHSLDVRRFYRGQLLPPSSP